MPSYKLVNPVLVGSINTSYQAKDESSAANEAWATLSKHITNNVPKFAFTLHGEGKLHHFMVREMADEKTKSVEFQIKPLNLKLSKKQEASFMSQVKKVENDVQNGGAPEDKKRYKKDDSSSTDEDSTDSDDEYGVHQRLQTLRAKRAMMPFYYFYYNPLVYSLVTSVYIPTFTVPIVPYIKINTSSAFFS